MAAMVRTAVALAWMVAGITAAPQTNFPGGLAAAPAPLPVPVAPRQVDAGLQQQEVEEQCCCVAEDQFCPDTESLTQPELDLVGLGLIDPRIVNRPAEECGAGQKLCCGGAQGRAATKSCLPPTKVVNRLDSWVEGCRETPLYPAYPAGKQCGERQAGLPSQQYAQVHRTVTAAWGQIQPCADFIKTDLNSDLPWRVPLVVSGAGRRQQLPGQLRGHPRGLQQLQADWQQGRHRRPQTASSASHRVCAHLTDYQPFYCIFCRENLQND